MCFIKGAATLYQKDVNIYSHILFSLFTCRLDKYQNIAETSVCMCVLAFMWNQSPLTLSAQGPYTLLFSEIVIDGQDLGVNKNPIPINNKISLSLALSFSFPSLTSCIHICSHTHKYKSYLGPLVSKEDYICPLGLFFCAVQQSRARELAVSPGLKPALSTSIRG